jgi:hypothetical protein
MTNFAPVFDQAFGDAPAVTSRVRKDDGGKLRHEPPDPDVNQWVGSGEYQPVHRAQALPCAPWTPILTCDLPDHLATAPGAPPNPLWTDMVRTATRILWAATGRRFGYCRAVERPMSLPCGCECGCTISCGDPWHDLSTIRLSRRPVAQLNEIVFDGQIQRLDQFAVATDGTVVSLGDAEFPTEQDVQLPLSEPGTWMIDYLYGKQVPDLGRMAVGELAIELGKACNSDSSCKLPQRVQTISRQGMSVTLLDTQDHLKNGLWGLTLVDQFISTENPNRLRRSARIFRADKPCKPPTVRLPLDNRVRPPEEQIFGHGHPTDIGFVMPRRTDGLIAQPGDYYVDIGDPMRPSYRLSGTSSTFVSVQDPSMRLDEMAFNDDPDHDFVGDGTIGPTTAPRRPGDVYYDVDGDQLYEWRTT